jgi:AraC-like DNA-binding protein
MNKKQLYQPFELNVSGIEPWEQRALIYHFFEIVQILEGEGDRVVNENNFAYKPGDIFLFTPLDCRGFKSRSSTQFCSIRFSEVFLTQHKNNAERERITAWLQQLEQIFYQHNRYEPLVIRNGNDCKMVATLISSLANEYDRKQAYYEDNLQHLVTLVLNLLSRNIGHGPGKTTSNVNEEPLINKILSHIRRYIDDKEKLKVEYLSSQFNLSENYVGEYFKKITGESLQRYITLLRIKLIEQRLVSSDFTISEIAHEFGFTDGSHLTRQFKKHSGFSPLSYRKQRSTRQKQKLPS